MSYNKPTLNSVFTAAIVSSILIGTGGYFLRESYTIVNTWSPAKAIVTGHKSQTSGGRKGGTTYSERYSFEVDGVEYSGASSISTGFPFDVDDEVDILFNPENPLENDIHTIIRTWGFGAMFIICGLIGLLVFIYKPIKLHGLSRSHSGD